MYTYTYSSKSKHNFFFHILIRQTQGQLMNDLPSVQQVWGNDTTWASGDKHWRDAA